MRLVIFALWSLAKTVVATVPYHQYILAPSSRTLRPATIHAQHGTLSAETALLEGHKSPTDPPLVLHTFNSSVTYDFGKNIAGLVKLEVASQDGSVGVTFTESSLWISSAFSDPSADPAGMDTRLVFNITRPGLYEAPRKMERGAFRYLTVVNLGTEELSIKDFWIYFTPMPHWPDNALQDYTGWFHSNDEKLNRVWYAGAYTNQLVTIDPTRGYSPNFLDAAIFNGTLDAPPNSNADGTMNWWVNITVANGTSALVDGAKRDRLVWSGDMSISAPGIAVSTLDLVSIRNSLDSLFGFQSNTGLLPYAGYPIGMFDVLSFPYHLHVLIGVANYFLWSGDRSYLHSKWAGWKLGMEFAIQQVDSTGLANVTTSYDWLRFGMGGHNIEANAILFYTLQLGVALAHIENDTATADRWAQLASGVQSAAMSLLWQPSVGLFRDNETTTLAPQDGNAWAIKSGLVSSPSQISQIASALQARWGPYGAPAPEAGDAVSPFISGFELEAHFMANRTDAALALVRTMWADFMLDDPRMTNSTFIEGYSVTGSLHYAPNSNDAWISHAHGWSSGPTSSLMAFVGGIQILSEAGASWAIVPQLGDLEHVDAGFSTSKGLFSSKWSVYGSVFKLQINTPKGTAGTVGLPLPGGHAKATVTGGPGGLRDAVLEGDDSGRVWIEDVQGGEYEFVVRGM